MEEKTCNGCEGKDIRCRTCIYFQIVWIKIKQKHLRSDKNFCKLRKKFLYDERGCENWQEKEFKLDFSNQTFKGFIKESNMKIIDLDAGKITN